jgi:hypothetical protein
MLVSMIHCFVLSKSDVQLLFCVIIPTDFHAFCFLVLSSISVANVSHVLGTEHTLSIDNTRRFRYSLLQCSLRFCQSELETNVPVCSVLLEIRFRLLLFLYAHFVVSKFINFIYTITAPLEGISA